jgi:hypothetical protein
MSRPVLVRLCVHSLILTIWFGLSVFCLTRPGQTLARSLPFIAFDSNFAIVYSAASAIEALHAGRKADPEDPA